MNLRLKILSITTAFIFFLIIILLLKKRKLKEKYALFWIFTGIGVIIISLFFLSILVPVSKFLGIENPNNTLFFFSIIFIIFSFLILSIEVSDLSLKTKNLIQEISIIKTEIERLKTKIRRKK